MHVSVQLLRDYPCAFSYSLCSCSRCAARHYVLHEVRAPGPNPTASVLPPVLLPVSSHGCNFHGTHYRCPTEPRSLRVPRGALFSISQRALTPISISPRYHLLYVSQESRCYAPLGCRLITRLQRCRTHLHKLLAGLCAGRPFGTYRHSIPFPNSWQLSSSPGHSAQSCVIGMQRTLLCWRDAHVCHGALASYLPWLSA